jgi:tetraacyldisaccharide-1-P 4'-kinase
MEEGSDEIYVTEEDAHKVPQFFGKAVWEVKVHSCFDTNKKYTFTMKEENLNLPLDLYLV